MTALGKYSKVKRMAILGAVVIAFLLFLSTLQLDINNSRHPYATDVGEIQNALPHWGTLHGSGYPLYSFIGSIFVTLLRSLGVAPALSASLYSAVWGGLTIGFLAALLLTLRVPPLVATAVSILFALSTSMWVDSSLAEVHTMTMALTLASLLFAVRFSRHGQKRDLYWLAFVSSQGFFHQRSFVFLVPALSLLVYPHWRLIWQLKWRVLGLGLLGLVPYIYPPVRAWMGHNWVFHWAGNWDGFLTLLLDTKADRIVSLPQTEGAVAMQLQAVGQILHEDWAWPLLLIGLSGLVFTTNLSRREKLAFVSVVICYLGLSFIIWEGYISDALLAVKMPIVGMAAVGLGLLAAHIWRPTILWRQVLVLGVLGFVGIFLFAQNRPVVLSVTRAEGGRELIDHVASIDWEVHAENGRMPTLLTFWGPTYWQLAYAQEIEGQFPNLPLLKPHAGLSRTFPRRLASGYDDCCFASIPSRRLGSLLRDPIYNSTFFRFAR